jgi:hypothetical protein
VGAARGGAARGGAARGGAARGGAARAGAALAGLAWLAGTTEFAAARVRRAPGSHPGALIVTSVLIPPLAVGHWLRGWIRHRTAGPWPPVVRPPAGPDQAAWPAAKPGVNPARTQARTRA